MAPRGVFWAAIRCDPEFPRQERSMNSRFLIVLTALVAATTLAACGQDSSKAAADAKKAASEAADKAKEAATKAAEATKEAAKEATDATKEAATKAADATKDA